MSASICIVEEFSLTSPAFANGSQIPKKYGYKHGNSSPPLHLNNIPDGCKSLALIMDDPDAMGAVGKIWTHWLIWNISPETSAILESKVPEHAIQGITDFGKIGYGGPAPPDRQHTYVFKLYALDSVLNLSEGADKGQLERAINDHIISSSKLTGTFAPQ